MPHDWRTNLTAVVQTSRKFENIDMSASSNFTLQPVDDDSIQCLFYSLSFDSASAIKNTCSEINDTILSMSKDYIWHRDAFQVYIPILDSKDTGNPFYICSTTYFGDNIEDEWYIVHLVLEISTRFPDLIIQVMDNDGELLLIEAADYLPQWIDPDNMTNRVFICNSHIHIIPPEEAPLDTKLELKTALEIITKSPKITQASNEIEQAVFNRIGNYPEKLLANVHRAVVHLPSHLAALLVLKPSLIAPIVDAYCNHDIIDTKSCKNINFSDCVDIEVKFTKYLYATIMHSKIINNLKHLTCNNDKKTILGLKLLCGYHIIMSKASSDVFSCKEYHRFINSLKLNGYFKNNIEGSKEYNQLLENANEYFSIMECPISTYLARNISEIMKSNDYIQIKDSIKENYKIEPGYNGDSEDWLNVNPEQLNKFLFDRYGKTSSLNHNDMLSSEKVASELSSFLKQTSDFEGIEPNLNEKFDDNNIDFEPDQFVSCIEKMLNKLSTGGDLDDISNTSDDGILYDDEDEHEDYDMELRAKLQSDTSESLQDSKTILENIVKSMKEEKASTGPTSNLLRTMGIGKTELLDSDDDSD